MAEDEDYLSFLDRVAREYGIPPAEARAIYQLESSSGANVKRSTAGAIGHMQIMPGTAKELGVDPYDPYQNIRGGVRYYAQQRKRFGDPALAAAAYNAGPGRVQRAGNRVPQIEETQNYVTNFLRQIGRVRPSQPAPASATMPPQTGVPQGQASMDETEDEIGGALPGALSAPTAAEFQDFARRSAEAQTQGAAMRKEQFEQGQQLIQQMYGGPSTSDRLWALSQALLSPKPYRGFAGTAYNVTRALGDVEQRATEAEKRRAEALMRLQQSYQTGEMEGAQTALDRELELLKARYQAAKPGALKSVIIEAGVPYEPGTGERLNVPNEAAYSALRANPTAENYNRFVQTFGERFAEKALRIVQSLNPNLRAR